MKQRITWLGALLVACALLTASPAAASSVQSLTAPTLSSTAAGVSHVRYSFSFTASGPVAGASGTIVVTGPTGTVMPTVAQIHNNTTNTTLSRSGTLSNSDRTATIHLCCSDVINPGDSITVTLDDVTNGSAAPSPTLDVSTSGDTAPATSPPYTLDAPNPVTNVTAPTVSSTAGGVQHVRYSLSFTTGAGNGGLVNQGTITIAAPSGTTLPGVALIHDDTAGTSLSRAGTRSNGNATLTLSLCCSDAIAAGHQLTITLDDVTNPTAAGSPYTLAVSTSSSPTPVASPGYSFDATNPVTNVTAPTVSSTAGGVQHVRYSLSFKTGAGNGGLVNQGTITIAAPPGTVMPTVAQIHNDTAGTSLSRSGVRSNSNATLTLSLCCSDAIGAGDQLTITLDDVTNPATGGPYTLAVSTSSSPTPVNSTSYSFIAPQQITGLTGVSLSSAAGGVEHVRYSFGFTTGASTGGLVAPGTIKIVAPAGTVLPTFALIHDDTTGTSLSRSGVRSNGNATLTLALCCSDAIAAGDHVTVTIDDVTNAATGGGYSFDVSTSSNPTPVTSPAYSLSAPQQVTDVTSVTTTTGTHGIVNDSFSFKPSVPTGGLVASGTITIAAPAGTVLPTFAEIRNDTAGTSFSRSGVRSNANATLTLSLCCSDVINPGDAVTVTLADVTNPAGGAGPFQVSTSSDPTAVTTPPPGSSPPPDTGPPPSNSGPGPPPAVPPPVVGKRATAVAEQGTVRVKLPGQQGFVALSDATSIPVGSILDTTHGQVGLTFATNATGGTQRGSFSDGQFQVQQTSKNRLTTLSMVGGGLNACKAKLPKGGAAKQSARAARTRRRTLFSSVKGRFRTRGRNSSATVRGTKWRVTDTCSGTKTTVLQGSVVVRDLILRRNVVVKAGHSYLAHAHLRKKKRH